MKIRKVASYTPEYPSKLKSTALKLGAAAAAAVMAAGSAGCFPRPSGYMEYRDPTATEETVEPTEEVKLDGDVTVETEEPGEDQPLLGLIVAPDPTLAPDDGNVLDAPRDTIAPPDNG